MFERGEIELVQHVITQCNQYMTNTLRSMDLEKYDKTICTVIRNSMNARDIIKQAIQLRLEAQAPFVKMGKWPEAMALFAFGKSVPELNPVLSLVNNAQHGMYQIAILADEIVHLAKQYDVDVWLKKILSLCSSFNGMQNVLPLHPFMP